MSDEETAATLAIETSATAPRDVKCIAHLTEAAEHLTLRLRDANAAPLLGLLGAVRELPTNDAARRLLVRN